MVKKNIALLIGIRYMGTTAQLNGCHNDIEKIKGVLKTHYNYDDKNIVMLMDKSGHIQPTAKNIINQLNSIYLQSKKGLINEIYVHYSGHGTNVVDRNGDETDGRDECIVPVDYAKSGLITDDLIYRFLSVLKPVGKITWVFDSCNSASCSDLPYSFTVNKSNNQLVKQNLSKRKAIANNKNIFILSGCLDAKVSWDVRDADGIAGGLLTICLVKTLKEYNYTCTIKQLLTNIQKLFGSHDQNPVLSVNSNNYGQNTICFEKTTPPTQPIQPTQPTQPIQPTQQTQLTQPTQSTKPTQSQLDKIKQQNLKINALSKEFNGFVNRSKTSSLKQFDKEKKSFALKLNNISTDLIK